MEIILWILVICLAVYVAGRLVLACLGKEDVVVDTTAPFEKAQMDAQSIVLKKKLTFRNEGGSCATIMDAITRPQLPYEQYDAIEARGKAEREGAPREDDYFEAVLIQKKGDRNGEDVLHIFAEVKLTARKGLSLKDALTHMVDVPLDFIWMETGRTPWHYRKVRFTLTAEEIAQIAGITLAKD